MEIRIPDLGVDSAEVSEVLVAIGDVVAVDENLVVLESDKAVVEVPSTVKGTIKSIMVSVGDMVSEGVVIVDIEVTSDTIEDNTNAINNTPKSIQPPTQTVDFTTDNKKHDNQQTIEVSDVSESEKSKVPSQSTITLTIPDLGVDEAVVAELMVQQNDTVTENQPLILVESDKASVEVPATQAGVVSQILVTVGDVVKQNQGFVVLSSQANIQESSNLHVYDAPSDADSITKNTDMETNTEANQQLTDTNNIAPTSIELEKANNSKDITDVYAGPAVRKLARQLGVDITKVSGSAINQRVVKEDIFAYVKSTINQPEGDASFANNTANQSNNNTAQASLPKLPDMSKVDIWGEIERQPLSRLQKVSIPQLNHNNLIPQVTQFDLADITETEAFRGKIKAEYKAQGIGLTILAFIVKAVAYALIQHPKFNSHLSDDNTELLIRKQVNMGIAVATEDGLIVPVIKNAQAKGIKELAIEISSLAQKARDKKLSPKDITGASFTISSQGNLGGTAFTPLVTWPQVAILGVSEASMQPRWQSNQATFEPRLMLPLSLSYDHRVINGADAAVFTRFVANLLADPRQILM